MKRTTRVLVVLVAASGCVLWWTGDGLRAAGEADSITDGNRLAAVLRAGRAVVSANQPLINDAAKGDKGLTPDVFLEQMTAAYVEQNGEAPMNDGLTETQRLLTEAQMAAMAEVIGEQQDLINTPDMAFKGFIPAVFARLVNERFVEKVGSIASVKVTAPPDLVRNRTALPDPWETAVIADKFQSGDWVKGEPWYETVSEGDGTVFRMLIPEYYATSCLSCHGDPAGEVDVTGFPKEGRHEGDLGGAISITLRQ